MFRKYFIALSTVVVLAIATWSFISQLMPKPTHIDPSYWHVRPLWLVLLVAGLTLIFFAVRVWNNKRRDKQINKKFNRFK